MESKLRVWKWIKKLRENVKQMETINKENSDEKADKKLKMKTWETWMWT